MANLSTGAIAGHHRHATNDGGVPGGVDTMNVVNQLLRRLFLDARALRSTMARAIDLRKSADDEFRANPSES